MSRIKSPGSNPVISTYIISQTAGSSTESESRWRRITDIIRRDLEKKKRYS